jgi:hypothetical protein
MKYRSYARSTGKKLRRPSEATKESSSERLSEATLSSDSEDTSEADRSQKLKTFRRCHLRL